MKDDCYHAVRCVQCGHLLLCDEIRFLTEDTVGASKVEQTTARLKEGPE